LSTENASDRQVLSIHINYHIWSNNSFELILPSSHKEQTKSHSSSLLKHKSSHKSIK
jgi:hypothetical protein